MTSVTSQAFDFDPCFRSHDTMADNVDSVLLSTSMDSFFNEAFTKLSASPVGSTDAGFDFTTPGTTSPDTLLDARGKSAFRDGTLLAFPKSAASGPRCSSSGASAQDAETKEPTESREAQNSDSKQYRAMDCRKSMKKRQKKTTDTPEARTKRELSLEKNRIAANKCRRKKRDWTTKLENKHRRLSTRNKLLHSEAAELHDTIFGLKEMMFRHADCGFQPIDEYVRHDAENVRAKPRINIAGGSTWAPSPSRQQQRPPHTSPSFVLPGGHVYTSNGILRCSRLKLIRATGLSCPFKGFFVIS